MNKLSIDYECEPFPLDHHICCAPQKEETRKCTTFSANNIFSLECHTYIHLEVFFLTLCPVNNLTELPFCKSHIRTVRSDEPVAI